MNEILKGMFIMLGILFVVLIVAVALFIIFNPFSLMAPSQTNSESSSGSTDKNPLLDANQEKLLETMGVNVESLPAEITPEMEACFTEKLGAERVKEIMDGDSPSAIDFFMAKDCL
ncbi:MAG: hypothetical protein Q8Q48_04575 [Candidatus Staskawiczbacteria bacterium]|nr:hypothetical protein [Candidatus Staskawiczbacteria bacterium]